VVSLTSTDRPDRLSFVDAHMGAIFFGLSVLFAIPLFWYGLISLGEAWSTPEYSHGPLIPIVSAYLFLRDMKAVPKANGAVTDRWPGFWVVMAGFLIASVGNVSRIADIVTYGMIIWVWGMVLVSFGLRRGIVLWTGVLHLVYMLPLPNILYWQLSLNLQFISSEIGVALVRAMGIPVFLAGNIIDLGDYKLHVAEACSGLRYLFPVLSFSYIFCVLYQGPRWHKAVLLLAAAPITVLMNSFRIGVIGVLVNSYGIEHAEGFLHAFEGWVIFGACVAILFLMAVVMQRFTRNPKPLADTIDLDFSGLNHQLARVRDQLPSKAMLSTMVVTGMLAALTYVPLQSPEPIVREEFSSFPLRMDGWRGRSSELDPVIEEVLAADDYLASVYSKEGESAPVDFYVAYYRDQSEGDGIHSPEVCIPGGGWEMSAIEKTSTSVEVDGKTITLPINRAIIQRGLQRQLVYYWFEQRGRRLTSEYAIKYYSILDKFNRGRADGALVRSITPILPGESEAKADARLQRFLQVSFPRLGAYVPE